MAEKIRKSVIAGSWYPGNPQILESDIRHFFENASVEKVKGEIKSIVAPHAGYVYSGQIAGYVYRQLITTVFDDVIIIGPSHRSVLRGVSIFPSGGFETPLGVVKIDKDLADKLMKASPMISDIPSAHAQEHSVEIQLPFLQVALGEFSFVPLVMGIQDRETCTELARAIVDAVGIKHCLIVGSSDLSHFHSQQKASMLDKGVIRRLEDFDPDGLLADLEEDRVEACGGGPMVVAMMAAKALGASKVKVMPYANSGDITGEKDSVVGYASALFYEET